MPGRRPTISPLIIINSEEEWEVKEILDSRMKNKHLQYLVNWMGYNSAENSWEPDKILANTPEAIKESHNKHPDAPRNQGQQPSKISHGGSSKITPYHI